LTTPRHIAMRFAPQANADDWSWIVHSGLIQMPLDWEACLIVSALIMNRSILSLLVAAGVFGALSACGFTEDCQSMNFSTLAQANRMRIATNHDKTLRETTDQAEIAALVKFVSARTDSWCKPWAGVPVGLARAELYSDKKFLGAVSLGSNFAGAGAWRVRALEKAEREEFLRIFAVPDPYAK
jgi:hypothetical protein